MKLLLALFGLIVANFCDAGLPLVGPSAPGIVLHGPGAKANLVGPDGSHIVGHVSGGTVVRPPIPGGVVDGSVTPGIVAHTGPVLAHAAPAAIVPLPIFAHGGVEEGQPAFGVGTGHEGQYVHDYTEHLYDDGSYKGDYGHY